MKRGVSMRKLFPCTALLTLVLASVQYARTTRPQEIQSQFDVKIVAPQDGSEVGKEIKVKGTASIPSSHHLWVLIHRIKGFETVWWPQNEASVDPRTGKWNVPVFLGSDEDGGYEFEIAAITVDDKEHLRLQKYRKEAILKNAWPPIKMPPTTFPPVYRKVRRAG